MKDLKIGVALGGGGARGCCHVGVLKVLDEFGIVPYAISGVSMGALVGGLYTSGYTPKQMEEYLLNFRQSKVFDFNIFKLLRNGLFKGDKIHAFIDESTKKQKIEDCKIKFFTSSVDILSGKTCVISSGSFADAIYPSLAIPCVFTPFERDGKVLIDGGIVDNLPDGILKDIGCDVIITIDAMGTYECSKAPRSTFEIAENTLYILAFQNQQRIEKCSDIIITPKQDLKMYHLRKNDMIESMKAGEDATRKCIDEILKIIEEKNHE
ncbi:MAG: patatin-like phospholipase family protein [Clostridia bacterium]